MQRDHSFVKLPLSELLTHGFGPKSLPQPALLTEGAAVDI